MDNTRNHDLNARFYEQWNKHVSSVTGAREKFDSEAKRAKGGGAAKAKDEFDSALAAARDQSRPVLESILEDMGMGLEPQTMAAPSDEQLRLLQTLNMRDTLTAEEVEAAARSLAGNEAAFAALGDIARRNGRDLPPSVKSRGERARAAHAELSAAADKLMAWDGSGGAEFSFGERTESAHDLFRALGVDIDAMQSSRR